MFVLLGLAVRIATRLGLHRDGGQTNMSPFEAEQRRRLWWQLVIFDKRIAEITGSTITALSSCSGDTRMPFNINDSDLNVHAKGPPGPYAGPTEMFFCLTRVELTVAASPDNVRKAVTTPGGRPLLHRPRVHYSPSPASPDMVTHMANQTLPNDLVAFCAYMENVYLKQCDPKIPLHYFTLLMTRQAVCKLRLIDFLCRTSNNDNADEGERDSYFLEALHMVEYDNLIQSSDMLQGFRWYTYAHFPLPAYLCLVSELRHRTTGDMCERAWSAMIENHESRGLLKRGMRNPLHIAFGRYMIKAWDAREAAELQLGRALPAPKVIVLLRNTITKCRRPAPGAVTHSGGAGAVGGQQAPVQHVAPSGIDNGTNMGAVGDMNTVPTGLPTGMYPGKPIPQSTTAPHMDRVSAGTGMMMDDQMMYSGYDNMNNSNNNNNNNNTNNNMNNMYGNSAATSSSMDVDYGHMDWNYLVQLSSFGGFNPPGSYYVQGTGA